MDLNLDTGRAVGDERDSPRPLRNPFAPRPEGSSIDGFYGHDAGQNFHAESAQAVIGKEDAQSKERLFDKMKRNALTKQRLMNLGNASGSDAASYDDGPSWSDGSSIRNLHRKDWVAVVDAGHVPDSSPSLSDSSLSNPYKRDWVDVGAGHVPDSCPSWSDSSLSTQCKTDKAVVGAGHVPHSGPCVPSSSLSSQWVVVEDQAKDMQWSVSDTTQGQGNGKGKGKSTQAPVPQADGQAPCTSTSIMQLGPVTMQTWSGSSAVIVKGISKPGALDALANQFAPTPSPLGD